MGLPRLIGKVLRTRFWDRRPFILSHLLTARCNADCVTCLWKMPADSQTDEMSTEQVEQLYRDAADAGFLSLVMWGGEPMLRSDCGRLIQTAREAGLETAIITNGYFLESQSTELLPYLDRLLISVDAVGELQDSIRKCPGLFERIDRGLELARSRYPKVRIIVLMVASKLNIDQLEAVAGYGKVLGAQVIIQAMNFSDYGFADRSLDLEKVGLDDQEEERVAAEVERLRKAGYPVRDSNAYLSRLGKGAFAYQCHYKKVILRVEPNGDVLDCTKEAAPVINVRTTKLDDYARSKQFQSFVLEAESCNRCRDAGVIETSHIWEGRLGAIVNAVRGLR